MPSEFQKLSDDVSYIRGKLDTVLPTIATKEFVRATVKEGLANHKTQCWKDETYQPAPRLRDKEIGGTPSLMPANKKTVTLLVGAIVSLVGLMTFVFTKLIDYLTRG